MLDDMVLDEYNAPEMVRLWSNQFNIYQVLTVVLSWEKKSKADAKKVERNLKKPGQKLNGKKTT